MKKLLSFLIAVVMISAAVAAALPYYAAAEFSDVEGGRWSEASIRYAVTEGYMKGVGSGLFDPEGSLTRAMVATVLWRREGEPAPAEPSGFADVPSGEWYADAVAWAKETGVVKGVTEKTFEPDGLITREQLATMLFRFSSSAPVSVPERADLTPFADDEKVSDWAGEPLEWAVQAGLIKGTDGNRLAPEGNATREQFAAITERYDGSFKLAYNEPVLFSHYTEPDYPLVEDADFYVSTTGSDSNDGSFEHPFASFERARDAVRALDKTGRSGITVAFMAGDYGPLSIELTEADSGTPECPITYCKYGDGDVVFNNGFDVKEAEFSPLDESDKALFSAKSAEKIKKADVSGRLVDYDPKTCMILSEDGTISLARYPNLYEDGGDQLIQSGITEDANHIRIYNTLYNRRVAKYHTTDGLIFYGYIVWGWYKDLITTDGYTVDPETGDYIYYVPHPEEAYGDAGLRYYPEFVGGFAYDFYQMAMLNVSEELDAPGEYWIDADAGTFYVYDPSGDYHFTGGGVMITLGKTEYINLVGLDFINSEDRFISAPDHPRGITFDLCRFEGCAGDSMVYVTATDEGRPLDLLVTRCEFSTCAEAALYVYTVNMEDLFGTGTGAVIDNNCFTLTNLRIGNSSALQAYATGGRVTHNHFKRCCWKCIGTGYSTNLLIEYNVFEEACCNGDDTGAIGKGSNIWASGTVIRNNLFLNITGGTNGRFGVYLDNAVGAEVDSNLFYNVNVSVMNNDISKYNTFRDNVTVRGPEVCEYSTNCTGFVIEMMTSGRESELVSSADYQRWVEIFDYFDSHPSIKAQATEYWPGLFEITTDLSRWEEREFCDNSSLVITGNRSFNETARQPEFKEIFARYSTIGDNIAYSFEDNPIFVNPTRGDYRIREGADFPDIEFEKIGRY